MEHEVRAALRVLGLTELPKTQAELKKVFRRQAIKTHPDRFENDSSDDMPFKRVQRANEILIEAVDEADKPCVLIKFGGVNPHPAKVAHNRFKEFEPAKDCKYIVALKWFMGLSVQVADGEWHDVDVRESFALDGVWIQFVY